METATIVSTVHYIVQTHNSFTHPQEDKYVETSCACCPIIVEHTPGWRSQEIAFSNVVRHKTR